MVDNNLVFSNILEYKYDFKVSESVVTYNQWKKEFSNYDFNNKSLDSRNDYPVIFINNFFDIIRYCDALEKRMIKEGLINDSQYIDLLNVNEWEYSCLGTKSEIEVLGDDYERLKIFGWYEANSGDKVHMVKGKRPTIFNLYDMYGNVMEWCYDEEIENKFHLLSLKEIEVLPALGGCFYDNDINCLINKYNFVGINNQYGEPVGFRLGVFNKNINRLLGNGSPRYR